MNNAFTGASTSRLINVAPCHESDEESGETVAGNEGRNSMVSNRASSLESSFSLDIVRPTTARSLPIPSRSKPPKINIIKSPSSESKNNQPDTIKHSNSTPLMIKPRKNSAGISTKTNLDTYLDYSISPFTTKFELIGSKTNYTSDGTRMRKCRSSTHLNKLKTTPDDHVDTAEPSFIQITNDLFCGNLSLVKNERQMCKMSIEYLIDMSNMRPEEMGAKTLGKIPCNCLKQHSRMYINIEIRQTDFKSLFKSFCEVNRFIQKSHKSPSTRRVLIFAKSTYSAEVVCAAAQYLMVEYDMSVEMALKSVAKQKFDYLYSRLDECYRHYLSDFEKYLSYMSVKVFGKFGYDGEEGREKRSLQAKRDMFEENFEFYNENGIEEADDDDDEFDRSSRLQSSMTNLVESDDRKNSTTPNRQAQSQKSSR